jgi:hypothetical protein
MGAPGTAGIYGAQELKLYACLRTQRLHPRSSRADRWKCRFRVLSDMSVLRATSLTEGPASINCRTAASRYCSVKTLFITFCFISASMKCLHLATSWRPLFRGKLTPVKIGSLVGCSSDVCTVPG